MSGGEERPEAAQPTSGALALFARALPHLFQPRPSWLSFPSEEPEQDALGEFVFGLAALVVSGDH